MSNTNDAPVAELGSSVACIDVTFRVPRNDLQRAATYAGLRAAYPGITPQELAGFCSTFHGQRIRWTVRQFGMFTCVRSEKGAHSTQAMAPQAAHPNVSVDDCTGLRVIAPKIKAHLARLAA